MTLRVHGALVLGEGEENNEDAKRVRVVFRVVRNRVISVMAIFDVSLLGAPTSISPESSKPRLRRLKKSTRPSTLANGGQSEHKHT